MNGPFGLANKTALVIGASSGIGEAAARLLARRGSKVCLVARRAERLEAIASSLRAEGRECRFLALDVAEEQAAEICFNRTHDFFGAVDILVISAGDGLLMSAVQTDEGDLRRLLELNAATPFRFCRVAGSKLNSGGAIALITSPAGMGGAAGLSAYALSKGGLGPLARSLAREYAKRVIRVNVVSPGYIRTEMSDRLYAKLTPEQLEETVVQHHPLGSGTPEDVAEAIVFLCSDAARWITGVTLAVDGGYTAGFES